MNSTTVVVDKTQECIATIMGWGDFGHYDFLIPQCLHARIQEFSSGGGGGSRSD